MWGEDFSWARKYDNPVDQSLRDQSTSLINCRRQSIATRSIWLSQINTPYQSLRDYFFRLQKTSKKQITQKSSVGNADVWITANHAASRRTAHEVVIRPTGKRTDSNSYDFFSMFLNEIHFFSQVLIPKATYSGQKETRLVNKNTVPRTSKVFPKNPETASVKNKYAKTIAATTRIPRSKFPMFFFIVLYFLRRWGWMVEGFVTYITAWLIRRIDHRRWWIYKINPLNLFQWLRRKQNCSILLNWINPILKNLEWLA